MMRKWFITGVSTGLGRSLARAALDRGDRVVGTVRDADHAAAFVAAVPTRSHALLLDVTDSVAVARAYDAAEALVGGIDVVVNNAGRGFTGANEETSLDDARALFEVNVFGALAVMQAALRHMRPRRAGHIINITSASGLAAWHGTGVYGATKFALECLGRTLAQEVAPLGIAVTNVAPGGLRTAFADDRLGGAAPVIADYAQTAHLARAILTRSHGQEPNSPDLAAQAILTALDAPVPPLELLLGADALHYAQDELGMLAREFAEWQGLTLGVTIPA